MENLPVEIYDLILTHLTLTDWKYLRLTSRSIYRRLSSLSSYSHLHPIILSPKSSTGITLLEQTPKFEGIEFLSLTNINQNQLKILIETSESFRLCLNQITGLSLADSTTLIDIQLFYYLLSHCLSLEKLNLSHLKFFFLSVNFSDNIHIYSSIKRLNLNGNTHLSDYAFNRLIQSFPNIEDLHLLNIPLRSNTNSCEHRTFLTFENFFIFFQKYQQQFQCLSISFEPSLVCDTQIKRLFRTTPSKLTYIHIDGALTITAFNHLLLLLMNNHLETLIIGRLILDSQGCQPLFDAINTYAIDLKKLCLFLNIPLKLSIVQQTKIFPILDPISDISLSNLHQLTDLDIQTLYPLNEFDLSHLFRQNLLSLKKLALPRNTTDDVIKHICTQSKFSKYLTHLNLSHCSSLSNRSILLINKYLCNIEELIVNYNTNINDFAFIGLSICGIGKSIEWLDLILIKREFIEELPIWSCTISHQISCQCQLPNLISSTCIKLRLRDFNFDYDEYSDRILSLLTNHKYFHEYFYSINQLQKLKSLKLSQCIQITNRLFRFGLCSLPNLKYLDVSGCDKLNDKNLKLIGQSCPSLEIIDITGCHRISENGKQILRNNAKRIQIIEF